MGCWQGRGCAVGRSEKRFLPFWLPLSAPSAAFLAQWHQHFQSFETAWGTVHRPETLAEWLRDDLASPGSTVKAQLASMPPLSPYGWI